MTGKAETDLSSADDLLEAVERLRPYLVQGALYLIPDAVTKRTDTDKLHPCVVVGAVPRPEIETDMLLKGQIKVMTRTSWKPEWGNPPSTPAEALDLRARYGKLFTAAGVVPAFTKDGAFEIRKARMIPVRALIGAQFQGWLPLEYIHPLLVEMGGQLPDPYPPTAA